MKRDKWGSCNSNDTQYNGQMKGYCVSFTFVPFHLGQAVIRMTHNTMANCVSFKLQMSLFIWPIAVIRMTLQYIWPNSKGQMGKL